MCRGFTGPAVHGRCRGECGEACTGRQCSERGEDTKSLLMGIESIVTFVFCDELTVCDDTREVLSWRYGNAAGEEFFSKSEK